MCQHDNYDLPEQRHPSMLENALYNDPKLEEARKEFAFYLKNAIRCAEKSGRYSEILFRELTDVFEKSISVAQKGILDFVTSPYFICYMLKTWLEGIKDEFPADEFTRIIKMTNDLIEKAKDNENAELNK